MLTQDIQDEVKRVLSHETAETSVIDVTKLAARIAARYELDEDNRRQIARQLADAALGLGLAVELSANAQVSGSGERPDGTELAKGD